MVMVSVWPTSMSPRLQVITPADSEQFKLPAATETDQHRRPAQHDQRRACGEGILFDVSVTDVAHPAGEHEDLLRATDTLHLLGVFAEAGLLSLEDVEALRAAYCGMRRRINHLALQEESPLVASDELAGERSAVVAIWDQLMAAGQDG